MNVTQARPLTTSEWDLVQRFVRFLNLPIETTTQVEAHFGTAQLVEGLRAIPAADVDAYRGDQARLQALVSPLADAFGNDHDRDRRAAVRALVPVLQAAFTRHAPRTRFTVEPTGRLSQVYRSHDVLLCCYLATALLIDPERGLLGRFGRCGFCGRFTITNTHKPRRHCSDEHAELFRRKTGAARVALSRERARERERQRRLSRQKGS